MTLQPFVQKVWLRFVVLVMAAFLSNSATAESPQKWFYAYVDLHSEEGNETNFGTNQFLNFLPTLKQQGYDAIVLSCFQFGDLPTLADDNENLIRKNLKSIVDLARKQKIEIIPEVMPVGPSESILQNDLSLAEGKQVNRQILVMQDLGKNLTVGLPQSRNSISMGDFWGSADQLNANWIIDDARVSQTVTDNITALEFKLTSLQSPEAEKSIEVGQGHVRLSPNQQYRLKFRLKTDGVVANRDFYAKISGLIEGSWYKLEEVDHKLDATQAWTEYTVLFNSYDCEVYKFWFGFTRVSGGTAWITDIEVTPALGANLLRRSNDPDTSGDEALPICVVDLTDQRELDEGEDFEVWSDPNLDKFGFRHSCADIPIRFMSDRIDTSHKYAVSYYHAVLQSKNNSHVCCSPRHPKVLALFRQQIALLNTSISPKRWLISHDEIRAMGHDPLANGDSPSHILQENFIACLRIIESVAPGTQPIVFNAMYDPHHLAVQKEKQASRYPMVNGEFFGSSAVLKGSDGQGRATILNWQTGDSNMDVEANIESWQQSLRLFAELKCPQVISAFYDVEEGDSTSAREEFVRKRTENIFQVAKALEIKPEAVCYYTVKRKTCYTEVFAEVAKKVFGE